MRIGSLVVRIRDFPPETIEYIKEAGYNPPQRNIEYLVIYVGKQTFLDGLKPAIVIEGYEKLSFDAEFFAEVLGPDDIDIQGIIDQSITQLA
jgi:hypothetical protein